MPNYWVQTFDYIMAAYEFYYADETCVVVQLRQTVVESKPNHFYQEIIKYVKDSIIHCVGISALPKFVLVSK